MNTQTYSRTAQGMAIFRAIEHNGRRAADRILSDPWAQELIPARWWRALLRVPFASRLLLRIADWWIPGAQDYAVIRARVVDDLTRTLARTGLKQVVLLGAGFDTMTFRLRESLAGVAVFEVDHPATQAAKRAGLAKLTAPQAVQFVPVDFEKDDLVRRLTESGFDPNRRSLITWLGVSYYLTAAAVARTLEQMARLCSAGSGMVFDYVPEPVIAGTVHDPVARASFKHTAKLGEPFIFGLDPRRVASFLARFGFRLTSSLERETLRRLYCRADRAPVDFMNIAICERTGGSRP